MHIASRTHGNDLAPETRYFVALLDSFGDLRDLSGVSRPVGAGVVERGSTVGDEVDGVILDAAGHVIGNLFQTPFPVRATMITAGELHVTDCFPYRFDTCVIGQGGGRQIAVAKGRSRGTKRIDADAVRRTSQTGDHLSGR